MAGGVNRLTRMIGYEFLQGQQGDFILTLRTIYYQEFILGKISQPLEIHKIRLLLKIFDSITFFVEVSRVDRVF